jgi:FKBP-type peptidyl-prolyl cis-trans isomerase
MLVGSAMAQQTPSSSPQSAPATKAQASPATTPHATTRPKSQAPLALKTEKDKASYAIGANIGRSLHRDGADVDPAIMARGLKDGFTGSKMLLSDQEAQAAMTTLQSDLRRKHDLRMQALGDANRKEGEAFLAANKTKEGVVTLPSGLQYKVLKEGSGPKPSVNDSVICNYRGTLLNNTEFDSSYKRGQPATFPVGHVIKGWTEALQLMPVGSKWQLFIPADLAYGERGTGPDIGPNATLVFEVELLSIQNKTQ